MGLLAAKQRRLEDAEALFRKSLKMREEWYGSSHPLVAEIFDVLASLACSDASDSPDVAVAEGLFRRALYMQEDLLGCSHLVVANTLFKLGRLLQAKGKKDATKEAKQLFQRALDIRTAKHGVYHVETKLIRRALMSLETVDVSAKFSGRGTVIEKELRALDGVRSRPLTKSSSRNLDFRQASGS